MNSPDVVTPWLAPLGWLALEAAVVTLAALALQPLLRTAAARRSLWRAVLIALIVVLAAELTGTGSQLPAQLRLAWQTTFPAPVPPPEPPPALEALPFLPPPVSSLAPIGGQGAFPAPEPIQLEPVSSLPPPPLPRSHPPTFSPAPPVWPAFLWLTGLAALLARAAWTHAGFAWLRLRHFLPAAEALRERVQELATRLGLRRRVRVLVSERLRAPAAFGWLRPGVGVPGDFTNRFAPAQQDVMLAHELAHLAARDPLWQLLADLAAAALWWHPLAWVARRQHRLAGELAADDASQALPDGPVVLAECLLALGHEAAEAPRAALGMAGFRSQLGRRVERLVALPRADWQAPSRLRLALQTTVALLALAALALLPGCAANRAESEAPSSLVTKWWQAKGKTPETQPRGATLLIQPKPKPAIIQGRVHFHGTQPPEREIPLPAPVLVARSNAPVLTRYHRVSPDGGLADVLVYVKEGLAGQALAAPTNTFVVQADRYEFEPYIGAIQAGQTVRWESHLITSLSIHPTPTNHENREFNFTLMAHKSLDARFTGPELFLRVKTDVYPWMYHYVSVLPHPYFAVTDADGRFRFPQPLPPGKYTLAAVHRRAGEAVQELDLTQPLPTGAPVTGVVFQFNAPPGSATPPPLVSTPQLPAPPLAADFKPSKPPTREELLERKARVEAEIKEAEKVFRTTHPKMVGLHKQLESLEEALRQLPPLQPALPNAGMDDQTRRKYEATLAELEQRQLQQAEQLRREGKSLKDGGPGTVRYDQMIKDLRKRLSTLPGGTNAIDISVGRQLFVDHFLIESNTLKRTWHQPSVVGLPQLTVKSTGPLRGEFHFPEAAWYDAASQEFRLRFAFRTNSALFRSPSGTNWFTTHNPLTITDAATSGKRPERASTDYESHRITLHRVFPLDDDPLSSGLYVSADRGGIAFSESSARTLIPVPQPEDGSRWSDLHPLTNGFLVVGRNLHFYFGGRVQRAGDTHPSPAVGLATLRRDGFVSLDAGPEGGVLTTKPVTFTGRFMFVNFKTNAPDGEMRIEILHPDGRPIEVTKNDTKKRSLPFSRENCIPLAADQTLMGVSWQDGAQDLSGFIGKPVRFRFHLKNASLYSFWVGPGQLGRSMGRVAGGGPHFTSDVDTIGNRSYQPFPVKPLPPPKPGTLTVGDTLKVEVVHGAKGNHTLRSQVRVQSNGNVSLSGIAPVLVAGKTPEEARESIREAFLAAKVENPVVTVSKNEPSPAPQPAPPAPKPGAANPVPSTPVAADVRRLTSPQTPDPRPQTPPASQRLVTSSPTNAAPLHHQPTVEKLARTRLPEVTYDGLPLSEVLKFLKADSKKYDPDKAGVEFGMQSVYTNTAFVGYDSTPPEFSGVIKAESARSGTVGVSLTANVPLPRTRIRQVVRTDMETTLIHVSTVLRDVSVLDALDAIVKTAGSAIGYTVETNRVVIHPRLPGHEFKSPRAGINAPGAALRALAEKMVFPSVIYDGLPLPEVVNLLTADARKHDPDKRGVNFLFTSHFPDPPVQPPDEIPLLDPQGKPLLIHPDPVPVRPDLWTALVHVPHEIRGLTLAQTLDLICKTADVRWPNGRAAGLSYAFEDYGIIFRCRFGQPLPAPSASSQVAAQALRARLDRIVIPRVEFRARSLGETLKELAALARDHDPDRRGVNLLTTRHFPDRPAGWRGPVIGLDGKLLPPPMPPPRVAAGNLESTAAWTVLAPSDQPDLEELFIGLPKPMIGQPLPRVLDAICQASPYPITYRVEAYGVLITPDYAPRPAPVNAPANQPEPAKPPKPGASAPVPSPQTPDARRQTLPAGQSLVTSAATPVQLAAASPKDIRLPVPNPYHRTNSQVPFLTHSSKGAQRINRKLEEIVLPEVHFDAVPLVGVVQRLIEDAKKFDPEKKGLNFLINDVSPAAPLLDAAGNPVPVARPVALSEGLVRVNQPLKNLTLRQALDVICKNAELPTQFSVEEYAIAFIPRGPVAYYSRMFRVNPDTFIQGLQGVVGNPVLGAVGQSVPAAGQAGQVPSPAPAAPVRATVPATVPATPRTAAEANALVRQFFQSAGVTALGATNGSTRVTFNPENGLLLVRGTTNELRLIEQAIQKVQPPLLMPTNPVPSNLPKPNPYYRTNAPVQPAPHSSKGAQRINAKLDEIILPEIHFDSVSLPAVVTWLDANVKKHDPEKKGLNFLINNLVSDYISPKAAAPLLDPKGNPISSPRPAPKPDLAGALLKVPVALTNLTLRQALDVICKATVIKPVEGRGQGLKYSVEDYAIVFTPTRPEQADLFSRIFKVDPETFIKGLGSVVDEKQLRPGSRAAIDQALREKVWTNVPAGTNRFLVGGVAGAKGGTGVVNTNVTAELNHLVRLYFTAAGVSTLGETNNVGPDATQVFFNDRNGLLLVRASLQDLEIIQQAVELLNAKPAIKSPETK